MEKLLLLFCVSLSFGVLHAQTPKGFSDDYDASLKAAEKSGKQVLAVFSGSDWCAWCQKLEEEVLSQPEFVGEASKRFELVYLDFPQDASRVSAKAAKRNPELAEKYKVQGFPSVLILDAKGGLVAQTEYQPGGAENYLRHLREVAETAPLVERHLKPYRQELKKATDEMNEELLTALAGGSDAQSDPKALQARIRAKVRELAPKYRKRLTRFAERLKAASMPERIAEAKRGLLSQAEMLLAGFDRAERDDQPAKATEAASGDEQAWLADWSENVRTNLSLETCASFRERRLRPFLRREMDPAGTATAEELRLLDAAIDHVWGLGAFRGFGERAKLVETLDRLGRKPFAAMIRAFADKKDAQAKAAAWAADRGFVGEDLRAVFATLRNDLASDDADFLERLEKAGADEWLRQIWRIGVTRAAAWKARGGGYANTVSDEGWKGFRKSGDECRAAFRRAMELHSFPEPTYVFSRLGPFEDEVFRSATTAQLDFPWLYRNYVWYDCFPRWCGSHAKMKAFAERCRATKRHDTMVPFHYAETLFRMIKDMGRSPEDYFRERPEELERVIEVAVPQIGSTNAFGFVRQCACAYASIAYALRGDYARAGETFGSLGHRTFPDAIWSYVDNFSHWWMILDGISGRNRAEMQTLHGLFVAGAHRRFLERLDELRGRLTLEGKEATYAKEMELAARMEVDFPEGRPVVAPFTKDKMGWLTYGGGWGVADGFAYRDGKYDSGRMLEWDVEVPGEFRVECEVAPNGGKTAWQFEFCQKPSAGTGASERYPYLLFRFEKNQGTVALGEWRQLHKKNGGVRAELTRIGEKVALTLVYKAGKVSVFVDGAEQPQLASDAFARVLRQIGKGRLRFNGEHVRLLSLKVVKP